MKRLVLPLGMVTLLMASCVSKPAEQLTKSGLNPANFQTLVDNQPVGLYTLTNKSGMEVCITNFGARIVSIMVPDRNGEMKDVVLAFDSIQTYQNVPSDFGASIGRFANRINHGQFVLDGNTIQLPTNSGGHTLHGGQKGWQYKVYTAKPIGQNAIALTIDSPDGDMQFPGNVKATVTYILTDDNAIDIKYEATTDKKTIINMTNHSYFNLSGDPRQTVLGDSLYINADYFTPVGATLIPTGTFEPVAGTPMDFTKTKLIGADINKTDYEQVKFGNGFDHNWVLNTKGDIKQLAAKVISPASGITLEVYTNEPGIQVYTGNFLNGSAIGKKGIAYQQRSAICLETQHYPDSPNKPDWPTTMLEPGQTYRSECIYKFGVEK